MSTASELFSQGLRVHVNDETIGSQSGSDIAPLDGGGSGDSLYGGGGVDFAGHASASACVRADLLNPTNNTEVAQSAVWSPVHMGNVGSVLFPAGLPFSPPVCLSECLESFGLPGCHMADGPVAWS